MKILILIFFVTISNIVSTQSTQKTFELKNGSVVTGVVVEEVPGKSYKVKTTDGNIFVFEADEIKKIILKENIEDEKPKKEKRKITEDEKLKEGVSYYNMNEVVLGSAGMDGDFNMVMGLNSINGIQINSFQLGVGLEYVFSPGDVNLTFLPIYLDMRYLFSNSRRSFFALADIGYSNADGSEFVSINNGNSYSSSSFSYSGGFFFRIGGGYNFPISNKIDANINISYMMYGYDAWLRTTSSVNAGGSSSYSSTSENFSGTDGMFAVKFGIGFGK